MDYYGSADWHLGHTRIKELATRPDNYEELIVEHHNEVMTEEDVLVLAGDFSFYVDRKYLRRYLDRIKCRSKILVTGNHDKQSTKFYYDCGFNFVCDSFSKYNIIVTHKPMLEIPKCFDYNLHGHLHRGLQRDPQLSHANLLLSLEINNYYPVKLSDVLSKRAIHGYYAVPRNFNAQLTK